MLAVPVFAVSAAVEPARLLLVTERMIEAESSATKKYFLYLIDRGVYLFDQGSVLHPAIWLGLGPGLAVVVVVGAQASKASKL